MHFAKEMGSTGESFSHTGYEPKDYFLTETHVEFNQESMTEQRIPEQRFLEDVDYDDAAIGEMLFKAYWEQVYHSQREGLSVGQSSSSMSDRTGQPVVATVAKSHDRTGQPVVETGQELNLEHAQILDSFEPTEGPNPREINNSFMHSYWSKTGIYMKLMRKVSQKWKNWRSSRVLPSTLLREEDQSKIRTLFWSLLVRYRNCKMKFIVRMIREIFKMMNQYAVDIPTLPVNMCLSHLIQFLMECEAVLLECRAAEKSRQAFGTRMVYRGTFFANPVASSTAPYPQ